MNPRQATSWSTNKDSAKVFMGYGNGIIFEKSTTDSDVIINLELLDNMFSLPLTERWAMGENEVLLYGNGTAQEDKITPSIDKFTFEYNEK